MSYISFQPQDYFNTKLYTGNGSTQSISSVGFQPDWVWLKGRSGSGRDHLLFDAIRGATNYIKSNANSAEATISSTLTSFDSDGFSIGSNGGVNTNSETFVSWNWLGNGAGSSNTDGDITATVSASTTSGFSIVKYTGNGSSGATVGHGLGSDVKMVMCKGLGDTYGWKVWHTDLASGKTLNLHNDNAEATDSNYISSANSTTFTTTGTYSVNESGSDYIAYCFAEKKGFSKFGSYTGNGNADGTFIYTGFKPAFVMVKNISNTQSWYILDNKRNTYNPLDKYMSADTTAADQTATFWDYLSNGIKIRGTISGFNTSGDNYIYMAFAEEPLVSSNGVPAVAR